MKWMRERDALIAQTLAFVQSVTGQKDAGEPLSATVPEPLPRPALPADIPRPSLPATVGAGAAKTPDPASPAPRAPAPSDFQSELKSRIASFRAHQERFNREREEYFSATLARLRAAIKDGPPPRPRG
jgi:hypothetical protein